MSKSSYVIGNSYSLANLSEAERRHLDTEPWVFGLNSFLSHWKVAGFRPSVWIWGDNNSATNVREFGCECKAWSEDWSLVERITHAFAAKEDFPAEALAMARQWGVPVKWYRRGQPWHLGQALATNRTDLIYHCGSTLTNAVNFAWLLNPGQPICIIGNEWGDGFGHFWEGKVDRCRGRRLAFWRNVKEYMWAGLRELHDRDGLPIIDCNEHPEPLPDELRLPVGRLLG